MNELPKCVLCQVPPEHSESGAYLWCSNSSCTLYHHAMIKPEWIKLHGRAGISAEHARCLRELAADPNLTPEDHEVCRAALAALEVQNGG
jgi:hypothetical protein